MPERIQAPQNNHRERILEAAARAFLQNGYQQTSTAEIARQAKLSKRELYTHFHDKRDMLAAVIAQLQADIQSHANLSWSSGGDVRDVLSTAGTKLLQFIGSERFGKLFRIVAAESFRDPVASEKFYQLGPAMGRKNTASYLKRQMATGNLRRADPLQAADDFLDLLVGARYLTAVVLGQTRTSPKLHAHVQHAVDVFLTYYGVQKAPRN